MKTIYKQTSTGATQTWRQEIHGNKYRTVSGQIDGKQVTSAWKTCKGKNTGKSNETSDEQQCANEVESNYTKKLAQGGYHEKLSNISERKFFKPMLALKWKDYPTYIGYSQPKLDGIRCIMKADGMWSRQGKPIVSAPHVRAAFDGFLKANPTVIFDGELYADNLSDDFQKILSLARQTKPTAEDLAESAKYLKLHVYDLPSFVGNFTQRYVSLKNVIMQLPKPAFAVVELVRTDKLSKDNIDELYAEYMEAGYEGQIVRTDAANYEQKRSKQLLKRKVFTDKEFEIVEILEGQGNWAGYAKAVRIKLDDGTVQKTGLKGNQAYCKDLLKNKAKYVGGQATVRYIRLTNDGKLFHPVTVATYMGKRDL